jgi:hypothetical protein
MLLPRGEDESQGCLGWDYGDMTEVFDSILASGTDLSRHHYCDVHHECLYRPAGPFEDGLRWAGATPCSRRQRRQRKRRRRRWA